MPTQSLQTDLIDPVDLLAERFRDAIVAGSKAMGHDVDRASVDPLITPSRQEKLGDFQSNAAMPLGKRLGARTRARSPPRSSRSGPGRPRRAAVRRLDRRAPGSSTSRSARRARGRCSTALDTPTLGLPAPEHPETVVVDLCGVNLAKQMHVGHLRSNVIGDTIARVFERLGHTVVRQNHVGDWGLPIAMVTGKLMEGADAGRLDLDTLDLATRSTASTRTPSSSARPTARASPRCAKFDLGPKAAAELEEQVASAEDALADAKETLVKLQSHDPGDRGGLAPDRADHDGGLPRGVRAPAHAVTDTTPRASRPTRRTRRLVADLADAGRRRGIRRRPGRPRRGHQGALPDPQARRRVPLRDDRPRRDPPARAETRRHAVVYCVDARQALHFKQVFGAAHKAGYTALPTAGRRDARARRVRDRAGRGQQARSRPARARTSSSTTCSTKRSTGPRPRSGTRATGRDHDDPRAIAEAIGIAAIKYADLQTERSKDYVFSLRPDGQLRGQHRALPAVRAGPHQPHLRQGRPRRASTGRLGAGRSLIEADEEKTLALLLLRTPQVVRYVAESLEPHRAVRAPLRPRGRVQPVLRPLPGARRRRRGDAREPAAAVRADPARAHRRARDARAAARRADVTNEARTAQPSPS
jgi:arginyl-tRNA synthetase